MVLLRAEGDGCVVLVPSGGIHVTLTRRDASKTKLNPHRRTRAETYHLVNAKRVKAYPFRPSAAQGARFSVERPVNRSLGFCHRLRFGCRLARDHHIRNRRGPFPQMPPEALNEAVFDVPMSHLSRAFDRLKTAPFFDPQP